MRREVYRLSGHRHGAPLQVDDEFPHLDHRLPARCRSAKDGTEAGEQLIDADRLRDVVVRPGIERCNLLSLLAHGGEDDDRSAAPAAELASNFRPAAVWQ